MRFRVNVSKECSVLENITIKLEDLVNMEGIDAYLNMSKTEASHSNLWLCQCKYDWINLNYVWHLGNANSKIY